MASQLPNTSCIPLSVCGRGSMASVVVMIRRSWLSRGRHMSRCSPKLTGWLYKYVVLWRILRIVMWACRSRERRVEASEAYASADAALALRSCGRRLGGARAAFDERHLLDGVGGNDRGDDAFPR